MHFLVEIPDDCVKLAEEGVQLLKKVLGAAKTPSKEATLQASSDVVKDYFEDDKLYLISEGAVRFSIEGQLFMLFEEGDLLGIDVQRNLESTNISTDFAIKVKVLSKKKFLEIVLGDAELSALWLEYLNSQARLFLRLSGSFLKGGLEPETQFENLNKGDTIIEQGTQSTEVFTMIDGAADVLVDGVKVGEVAEGEIFGCLSAMTDTPRSATVIATTNCMVVRLPEDQFLDLIKSRPETVMSLCRDMANTIVGLNKKVVGLSKQLT